jgi:hypothetical protein
MPEPMKSLPSHTSHRKSPKGKSAPVFHWEVEDADGVGGKSHCGCSLDGLSDNREACIGNERPGAHAFKPGNYLVVREDHRDLINCVPCLQAMLAQAGKDYLRVVQDCVKEGEAKAHAQNEADRLHHQVEHLYTQSLSHSVEVLKTRAIADAAAEELHIYISMVRAKGEVRAAFDPVYRLYRDAKMKHGNLTPELRAKMLYESLPGDRKAMEAILKEDEHGQAVARESLRLSRLGRVPAAVEPKPITMPGRHSVVR